MAVTLTTTALAEALAVTQALADRLHPVAVALVDQYAPPAPEGVANEACIRVGGWLAEQPAASVTMEQTGDIATRYAVNNLSALRHSGAAALLTYWKVRRARAIGERGVRHSGGSPGRSCGCARGRAGSMTWANWSRELSFGRPCAP